MFAAIGFISLALGCDGIEAEVVQFDFGYPAWSRMLERSSGSYQLMLMGLEQCSSFPSTLSNVVGIRLVDGIVHNDGGETSAVSILLGQHLEGSLKITMALDHQALDVFSVNQREELQLRWKSDQCSGAVYVRAIKPMSAPAKDQPEQELPDIEF